MGDRNGTPSEGTPLDAWIQQLCRATNDHDLEALVDCFAEDYVNETPVHPARGFRGRDQVRRNWTQIFAAVPDFSSSVRWVTAGDTVWSEWEMRGTRRDGSPHVMRGVVVFGVAAGRAAWARFYMEPVDASEMGVDAAVRSLVSAGRTGATGSEDRSAARPQQPATQR